MGSHGSFTDLNGAVEQFNLTIARLTNKIKTQQYSLSTVRIKNESLRREFAELRAEKHNLRMELQAKTKQLERQSQEIAGYQGNINDLELNYKVIREENAQLVENVKVLCRKVEELDPLVNQLRQGNEKLQAEVLESVADLRKKREIIEGLQVVAEQEVNDIYAKNLVLLDWMNKTILLQVANESVRLDLSKLRANLSEIEAKYKHSNEQLETLKNNCDEELNEWIPNYQQLRSEYQKQQIELNSFKDHDMVVKVFQLHQLLQELKTRIESASNIISAQENSEREICIENNMKECTGKVDDLADHKETLPKFDLSSLDKYMGLHFDVSVNFMSRLERIKAIESESALVCDAYKLSMYKILDKKKTLIQKYMAEIVSIGSKPIANKAEAERGEIMNYNGHLV